MAATVHAHALKHVGRNGQISLGQQYAGRHVLVDEGEPGVWIVPPAAASLLAATSWSASHSPTDAEVEDTLKCLGDDEA